MDLDILFAINSLAGKHIVLDNLAIFFAVWAIFALLIYLCAFALKSGKWFTVIAESIFAAITAYGINALIGAFFFRYRPFVVHQLTQLIDHSSTDKSFPSDHTAIAFAIATVITAYNRKAGIVALLIAFFIGLGRIYVGVHYPTDVIGGIVVGVCAGVLVVNIARMLLHSRRKTA